MIDALDARDAAAMRAVLLEHLRNKLEVVLTQLHAASKAEPDQAKA